MSKELVQRLRKWSGIRACIEAADLIERQGQIIEGFERLVIDAYARGVEWCEENPVDREYRFKAAQDFADYEIHVRSLTPEEGE